MQNADSLSTYMYRIILTLYTFYMNLQTWLGLYIMLYYVICLCVCVCVCVCVCTCVYGLENRCGAGRGRPWSGKRRQFIYLFIYRKKIKELAYDVRLHAWRPTLNPTTIISKASKMVEKIGDPSAATLGKRNLNQHVY